MIIFRYLLKSIIENKTKALLLLLSISLSAALYYIASSSNKSIMNIAEQKLNSLYGETQLVLTSKTDSTSTYIDKSIIDPKIEKEVAILNLKGEYSSNDSNVAVNIIGVDYEDLNKINRTVLLKTNSLTPFQDNNIIISNEASIKYKLSVGEEVSFNIQNKMQKFVVSAIAADQGFLYGQLNELTVIAPASYMEKTLGVHNKAHMIYLKTTAVSDAELTDTIDYFKDKYPNVEITRVSTEQFLDGLYSNINTPLSIMLFVLLIMSSFIIYTSFKLTVLERLQSVGTFLSLGATRLNINIIFIWESLIFGILGGLIGNILGILGGYFLIDITNKFKRFGIKTPITIYPTYIIHTMILAILLSVIASIIPIIKTNRISIKNIIFDIKLHKKTKRSVVFYLGLIIILFTLVDRRIFEDRYDAVLSIINIVLAIVGIIIVAEKLLVFISIPIKKILKNINETWFLALNNVTTSKIVINNVRLTALCICVLILVSTVSTTIIGGLNDLYSAYDNDIEIRDVRDMNKVEELLKTDAAIKRCTYLYNYYGAEVENEHLNIATIQGIEPEGYKTYNNYFTYSNGEKDLDTLKQVHRNILLSTSLLAKLNKKIGDSIVLLNSTGGKEVYSISGSFNAKMANMGSEALINKDFMISDFKVSKPNRIDVKFKDGINIDLAYEKIKDELGESVKSVIKEETRRNMDIKNNESFINILRGISIFSVVIGGFGILNNMFIGYLQRRKDFAVLNSIGMTIKQRNKMLLKEALLCSIISIVLSMFLTILMLLNLDGVYKIMGTYMEVVINFGDILTYSCIAILIIMISSIIAILNTKKTISIKDIRYE